MSGIPLGSKIGKRLRMAGHFDVPVVLEEVRPLGSGDSISYACRVRLPDGRLEETTLSADEAEALDRAPAEDLAGDGGLVDAEKLRLLIESARIRLAYAHDPQFAVSLSGIRTLPHQIEAVYQVMLPQPRLRFLLADDPGAGKTIMAGLLIKELKLREAIERILILCPAPLTIQWQDELLRWFGESFDIVFSAVDQQQLTNPWERSSQIIASMDYAKQEGVRERVWAQSWDLVIIDEAHKCSARTESMGENREPKVARTKRYELAQRLTAQANHVLLLTATPHHGDEDKFAHFLRLIDPDLFPEPHRLAQQAAEIRRKIFQLGKNSPWCLRRLKEDLRDANGRRLFPDRHAKTVTFTLSAEEYALYKRVTAYINEFIPQQSGRKRTSAALTRTVLQRRLVSSTCAIHESLKRRLQKLEELVKELEALPRDKQAKRLATLMGYYSDGEQDEDDLDEALRDQLVSEYTAAEQLDALRREIVALRDVVEQAREVREHAKDSKLAALRECLTEAQFADLKDGRGKLIIFTEHRDTLTYVRHHLERWGYTTCEIHGGMNPHERKRAQETFRTGAQICVATEAAGEGINLQFCHLMINYDMPWNPTRLEQRLGRIHRIGQLRDVYVFNFVATSSERGEPIVEGRILSRLLEKLDQMNEALEGRVFDVIGEVLSLNDVNLPEMLREAAYDPRRLDEYLDQIDRMDPAKLKQYEEATGIALARSHVDFSAFQRRNLEVEERRLMPRYVEAQFLAAAKEVGLQVKPRADGLWRVEHVLEELRSERLQSVLRLGKPERNYSKITFHKEHLEQDAHVDAVLVGPGHPLYAAVDEKLHSRLGALKGGVAVFIDPFCGEPYYLHFFEISIRGMDTKQREQQLYGEVVAVREAQGQYEILPSDVLLNFAAHPDTPLQINMAAVLEGRAKAGDYVRSTYQLECRRRCQSERERYARICRDYLEKSFNVRIARAQEQHMRLAAEALRKPEFQRAAEEAKKRVAELERQREERLEGLNRLQIARPGPVLPLGTAVVLAPEKDLTCQLADLAEDLDPDLRRKSELAAEDFVVKALLAEGFPPERIERVGHLNLGFDIRAHRVVDETMWEMLVKRIEVKGRRRSQPVRLTTNEWYKAAQLADSYWLYVVWDPLGPKPELVRIQNPATRLDHAKREIVATRFYEIPAEAVEDAAGRQP
ncbi:helicase (Snf2/Rad54 family) [Candidatus Sumerlaea chitinivorans]|uniref:Helicase (Snf2/Rad54 family) n=1 Tax=Sumerlaea chitinivorans TaxID=2250252 RepID=A0A2Z4Y9F6_SUMC1|nr:helicase (Snf2/Rad54 family) [Candidatus Sumerlaea chitinivorans]